MTRRRRFVVAFHQLDRCYGGREEGGWWFDAGQPAQEPELRRRTRVFRSRAKASRYRTRLLEVSRKASQGARSLGSVLYRGGQYGVIVQEGEQARPWPLHSPQYE